MTYFKIGFQFGMGVYIAERVLEIPSNIPEIKRKLHRIKRKCRRIIDQYNGKEVPKKKEPVLNVFPRCKNHIGFTIE